MRRRRRSSPLGLFFALLLGGLLVGGSVWLDRRGERVVAPVQAKNERVTLRNDPQGSWYRWYELGVGVGNSGAAPWVATIEVPEERYDSIRIGDSVEVRYLPQLPLFARAADRSTAVVAREAAQRVGIIPLLLWIACGVAGIWIAARIGTPVVLAVGLAWMAAGFPVLLRAPVPVIPSASETSARVTAVTLVAKSPERSRTRRRGRARASASIRRLEVPYQVVQLRLAPGGGADTVLALDAVDSGSVPGLAVGADLRVRYDPERPREARLAEGTRSFIERNRYHYLPAAIGIPVIGVLAGLGFRWRRRRSEEPAAPGDSASTKAVATNLR
jgi:hypothetical protein